MITLDYIIIGVSVAVYVLTFIYQGGKITMLESVLKNQGDFVNSYEKYKQLLNDTLNLSLQKQKTELELTFQNQSKKIADETLKIAFKTFQQESENMMKGWQELSQIAISIIMHEFPKKEDKVKRDKYIQDHYPHNAIYFIGFIDDYFDGKIKFDEK